MLIDLNFYAEPLGIFHNMKNYPRTLITSETSVSAYSRSALQPPLLRRLLLAAALPALSVALQAAAASVWVYAKDTVAIPSLAYGINNDWRQVPSTTFTAFETKLNTFGYSTMRYPGGFESEYYAWTSNTTPSWPNTPAAPGATPAQVLSKAPSATFVLRTREYINNPTTANKTMLSDLAFNLVTQYKNQVTVWEVGNEWYNFGGNRATNLQNYIAVAKAIAWRIKDADPTAVVFISADWTTPADITTMKNAFGNAWAKVDGVNLHIYAGDIDPDHNFSQVQSRIAQAKTNSGLSKIYVSEWNSSKAYTGNKVHLQGANTQMHLMWHMLRGGIYAAAIWPPVNSIPGLNLTNNDYSANYANGMAFDWMSADLTGLALNVTHQAIPAIAAREGNRLVIFLLGYDKGAYDVTINLNGYTASSVASANVMYSLAPNTATTPTVSNVTATLASNKVTVKINQGGTTRGANYEIIRIVLNGTVQ